MAQLPPDRLALPDPDEKDAYLYCVIPKGTATFKGGRMHALAGDFCVAYPLELIPPGRSFLAILAKMMQCAPSMIQTVTYEEYAHRIAHLDGQEVWDLPTARKRTDTDGDLDDL